MSKRGRRRVVCGVRGPYAGWWYCVLNYKHSGAHKDAKGEEWK